MTLQEYCFSTKPLELVHSDVCGPFKASRGGFCYFVTFQDDYTKFAMVYFMAKKSEVFQKFQEFSAVATKLHGADILKLCFQHSNAVQSLRVDGGGSILPMLSRPIANPLELLFLLPHHTPHHLLSTIQRLSTLGVYSKCTCACMHNFNVLKH